MVRSKMVGGTSRLSRKGSQHSHKEILEMRDQDDGYLAAKLTSERKVCFFVFVDCRKLRGWSLDFRVLLLLVL